MLPTSAELRARWIELCTPDESELKTSIHARVCSEHFSTSCYQRDLQHELLKLPLRKRLKPDALPNRNLVVTTKSGARSVVDVLTIRSDTELNRDNNNTTNRLMKLPMRSSIRIAKKKSIACLSDSFTRKINNKSRKVSKSDKLKFMAKLQLKFERNENISLPQYDFNLSLQKIVRTEDDVDDDMVKKIR